MVGRRLDRDAAARRARRARSSRGPPSRRWRSRATPRHACSIASSRTTATAHLEARGRWAAPGGAVRFQSSTAAGSTWAGSGMPRDWGLAGSGGRAARRERAPGDPRWTFDGRASRPGIRRTHVRLAVDLARRAARTGSRYATCSTRARRRHRARARDRFERARAAVAGLAHRARPSCAGCRTPAAGRERSRRAGCRSRTLGALAPAAEGWGGRAQGRLTLAGSPPHPEFDVDAHRRRLRLARLPRAARRGARRYHDGLLDVPAGARAPCRTWSRRSADSMPLQLALGRTPEVPDAPMSGDVDVPRGRSQAPARRWCRIIQSARGRFDLAATLAGTTRHRASTGRAHIRDGVVRPAGREEVLEGVYADLHFDESRIHARHAVRAAGPHRARVVAGRRGTERLRTQGLPLRPRACATSPRARKGSTRCSSTATSPWWMVRACCGQRLPQVHGRRAREAGRRRVRLRQPDRGAEARRPRREPLYWTYQIQARAPRAICTGGRRRATSSSTPSSTCEQTPDSLLIYGEMHLVKGHYFFLSNRFKISQADLTFDNQKGVDPILDITPRRGSSRAAANWPRAAAGQRTPPVETINAHLTGRSSQPVITLTSSSGWTSGRSSGSSRTDAFTAARATSHSARRPARRTTSPGSSRTSCPRDLSKFFNDAINQWEVRARPGRAAERAGGRGRERGRGHQPPDVAGRYRQRLPG